MDVLVFLCVKKPLNVFLYRQFILPLSLTAHKSRGYRLDFFFVSQEIRILIVSNAEIDFDVSLIYLLPLIIHC